MNDNIAKATTLAVQLKWQEAKELHLNDVRIGSFQLSNSMSILGKSDPLHPFFFFFIFLACPQVALDRAGYHYRIQRSIQFRESLSLVVDGAEMSRYSLPYFCVNDKETSEGWRIPTRMYGAILHGEFSASYVFPAFFPGGTNVVIEVQVWWLYIAIFVWPSLYFTFNTRNSTSTNTRVMIIACCFLRV
jgi:hypothetical protein